MRTFFLDIKLVNEQFVDVKINKNVYFKKPMTFQNPLLIGYH